jgi:BirA family biotin operon repressor/biotin-[acetyl-CoA-carboxylase] ligase
MTNLVTQILRQGLYSRVIARDIRFYSETESTMDEARLLAMGKVQEGMLIVAESQTKGRGRFARSWISSPGNLYFSTVLYPPIEALPFISIMAGVAVARAIEKSTNLKTTVKWPNDIIVNGKKVGGVLTECVVQGNEVSYLIIGIGVNIALDQTVFQGPLEGGTSLNIQSGAEVDRCLLARRLIHDLDYMYSELVKGNGPISEWQEMIDTVGKEIEVVVGEERLFGTAESLDAYCNLVLRLPNGDVRILSEGDVTLRVPK